MATTIGNEYEHIDFTHNNITTRHPIKDATARSMVGDIVKISDSDPQLPNNKIWIKETPNAEVQVPTYEEFEEVKAYAYRNKNLIDPAKASSGISDYIPIDSETRYVLTHKDRGSGNFSFTLYTYDANKANMQMSFIELTAGEYEKFLTFNTGRAYLKITVSSAPDSIDRTDISRVYLGKFSDGQSFVPYHYSVDEQIDNRGYYTKPVSGIPGSDIASGVIPVLTDLIDDTAGVGDSTKVWSADKSATEHNSLLSAFENIPDIISKNLMCVDVDNNLYPGVASKGGGWTTHSAGEIVFDDETLDGYPVIKAVGSFKSAFYKFIQAEAGKTYTFEAMVKAADASDIRMYVKAGSAPTANFSPISQQFTNIPNNTWTKIRASFVCTQSGTMNPTVTSAVSTTLYVSQYRLVEGTNVFSLKSTLESLQTGLSQKASDAEFQVVKEKTGYLVDLDGIKSFSLGSAADNPYVGTNWNVTLNTSIIAGQKIDVEFLSYSGTKLSVCSFGYIDSGNNYKALKTGLAIGDKVTATIPVDVTKLYFQFRRSENEFNVTGNVCITLNLDHTYHCEKDGSGDFKNFVQAVNAACNFMDSVLYVGPGTWDIIAELGTDYLNNVSTTQRGLYLKNRIHVIGSSEAVVECNYTGDRAETKTWLSAINSGEYGFTLENVVLKNYNCRYAVHDERDTATDQYINKYINCDIIQNNANGGNAACIGGGLGKDGYIVIDGCRFSNPNIETGSIVSYHNTWYNDGTGKSNVEIKGNYFDGVTGLRVAWFGASQEITTFKVHDNSFGKPIVHVVENQSMADAHPEWIKNTDVIAWNNEVRSN